MTTPTPPTRHVILIDPYLHRVTEVPWLSETRQREIIGMTTRYRVGLDTAHLANGDVMLVHGEGHYIEGQRFFEYEGGKEPRYAGIGIIVGLRNRESLILSPKTTLAQAIDNVTWMGGVSNMRGISREVDPADPANTTRILILDYNGEETWMTVEEYVNQDLPPRMIIDLPVYPYKLVP